LAANVDRSDGERTALQDSLMHSEASEAATRVAHEKSLSELKLLEKQYSDLLSERDKLRASLSKAQEDLSAAPQLDEMNNLQRINNTLRAELLSIRNALRTRFPDELSRTDVLEDWVPSLANAVVDALEEIAELKERSEHLVSENERSNAARIEMGKLLEIAENQIVLTREQGREDGKAENDYLISQLESKSESLRDELSHAKSTGERLVRECEELRDLCSKLTAQFNSRTNELDDAEEKIAYLQDQVGTLEEDLEEARLHSHARVEESTEARRAEVDKLIVELDNERLRRSHAEDAVLKAELELECSKALSFEAEMLVETHRKAEENLQIAIEQLGAEQEFEIQRQTAALAKQLKEAQDDTKKSAKLVEDAALASTRMKEQEVEIKELREALGRLADERVNLKLELEENLSRLNHPDAGGQLVDRRVVRQLLVSYFRVDSLRRRDVLELMSRMLAFSDEDMITVGMKRRALMDRIGSVVQAPHFDDGLLAPAGSVSEKWIEFLMNESLTEGERDEF
jgi:chromosome segregation ATPase